MNTRLGADHHQLSIPPISRDCSTTFRASRMIVTLRRKWYVSI